jgi:hypothetical protein
MEVSGFQIQLCCKHSDIFYTLFPKLGKILFNFLVTLTVANVIKEFKGVSCTTQDWLWPG